MTLSADAPAHHSFEVYFLKARGHCLPQWDAVLMGVLQPADTSYEMIPQYHPVVARP